MVDRLLRLLLVLSLCLGRVGAAVEAEVDRSRLYQDERLELTIRADPDSARYPLDLTPLSTLFNIDQQSQGQRLRRSSSGAMQAWREWHLWLRPRHIGTLAVPAFRLGNQRSEPILIEVLDPAQRGDDLPADAVSLEVQLADRELYIGQPTQLTIDLWYRLRLTGDYVNLSFADFNAELLDETNVIEYRNGRQVKRYRLVYRLTADHPGQLQLPPIRFVGQYLSGPYGERRQVERIQPAVSIAVKPIPQNYPDDAAWLPARQLSLSDNLPDRLQLTAHAHQDWTVTTDVEGLPPTRLPDPLASLLTHDDSDAWRLYRNAPEFNARQRRDLAALVFTEPGQQTLPAVRLPWWDLQLDRLAYAELPARTVQVMPEASEAFQPISAPDDTAAESGLPVALIWPWISLLLGLGWLASAVLVWLRRRKKARQRSTTAKPVAARRPKQLVAEDDPGCFRRGVLDWLQQEGLAADPVLAQLPGPAAAVWGRLNAALYGSPSMPAPSRAERKLLLRALLKKQPRSRRSDAGPTQLYPD